jgi:hypothetical protein
MTGRARRGHPARWYAARDGLPDRRWRNGSRLPPVELLATLADRIGAQFSASTVYGTPIERDGVTVVPVAAARFGVGGGGGGVTPAGYIELKGGRSRFVPVVHPARMLALIGCTVLAGLLIMRPVAERRRPSGLPWR